MSKVFLRGGGSHRQESTADPGHELLGEHVLDADDQNALCPAQPDPIVGKGHRRGGGGAGGVHEEIGTMNPQEFGHSGMGQPQNLHEHGLGERGPVAGLLHELQEAGVAGESRRHDDAGGLRHGRMEFPSRAERLAARGGLAVLGDGKPGVFEEFIGRGHRHPRGGVSAFVPCGGHRVVVGQRHLARLAHPGHDLVGTGNPVQVRLAVGALDQPLDVHVHDVASHVLGQFGQEAGTFQESVQGLVVEESWSAGQPHGHAGDPGFLFVFIEAPTLPGDVVCVFVFLWGRRDRDDR